MTKVQIDAAIRYNLKRGYSKEKVKSIQGVVGCKTDGVWGPNTIRGIATWQEARNLTADGKHGPKTARIMFPPVVQTESVILTESDHPVLHPLPPFTAKWGYDHCPWEYLKPCPTWEHLLKGGVFEDGLLKLVSGARTKKGKMVFSRAPDSWISLDEFSIGFAHWWAATAPELLAQIANRVPTLAAHAWGDEIAEKMTSEDWIASQIRAKRGKRPHQSRYDWLLAGWWEIGLHPDVIQVCIESWLKDYTPAGLRYMKEQGWRKATTLAGLIRVTNSRGAGGMRSLLKKTMSKTGSGDENLVMETLFFDEALYDHPNRWERIISMAEFHGNAPTVIVCAVDASPPPVVRVDGSIPSWYEKGL